MPNKPLSAWKRRGSLASEDDVKLRELYLDRNLPNIVIANNLSCSVSTVENRLKALGISRRKHKNHQQHLTPEEVKEIRKLDSLSPLSHEEIAEMFGRTKAIIQRVCNGRSYNGEAYN